MASTSGGSNEVSHPRHAGPADQVGQTRLPLLFRLVDTTVVGAENPVPLRDGDSILKDVTHALAYKILHMPIFSGSELMAPDFKHTGVFHLAGGMLEGKADLPSLQVSQAVVDVPVAEASWTSLAVVHGTFAPTTGAMSCKILHGITRIT